MNEQTRELLIKAIMSADGEAGIADLQDLLLLISLRKKQLSRKLVAQKGGVLGTLFGSKKDNNKVRIGGFP